MSHMVLRPGSLVAIIVVWLSIGLPQTDGVMQNAKNQQMPGDKPNIVIILIDDMVSPI